MKNYIFTIILLISILIFINFSSAELSAWIFNNDSIENLTLTEIVSDQYGLPCTSCIGSYILYNPDSTTANTSGVTNEIAPGLYNISLFPLNAIGFYPLILNFSKGNFNGTSNIFGIQIIDELTSSVVVTLNQTLYDMNISLNNTLENINTTLIDIIKNENASIHTRLLDFDSKLNLTLENINTSITGLIKGANLSIHLKIDDLNLTLNNSLENINLTLITTIKDTNTSLHDKIYYLNLTINNTFENLNQTLITMIKDANSSVLTRLYDINLTINNSLMNINLTIYGINRSLNNTLESINTTIWQMNDSVNRNYLDINGSLEEILLLIKINIPDYNAEVYKYDKNETHWGYLLDLRSNGVTTFQTIDLLVPIDNKEDILLLSDIGEVKNFKFNEDLLGNKFISFEADNLKLCNSFESLDLSRDCPKVTYFLYIKKDALKKDIDITNKELKNSIKLFFNEFKLWFWILGGIILLFLLLIGLFVMTNFKNNKRKNTRE